MEYNQILEKIKNKDFSYRDRDGNNLLHLLLQTEDYQFVDPKLVKKLLKQAPQLANQTNRLGFTPSQTLPSIQHRGRSSNRPMKRELYPYVAPGAAKDELYNALNISFYEQFYDPSIQHTAYRNWNCRAPLFQKPTLLCFLGRGSFTKDLITGATYQFMKAFGLNNLDLSKLTVVTARYPGSGRDLLNDWLGTHDPKQDTTKPDHPMIYVRNFVRDQVRPLYLSNDEKPLPIHQVLHNIRRVNLFGYSYGAGVIHMLHDALQQDMLEHHFTPKQTKTVLSQIPALIIGSDLTKFNYKTNFRTHHIVATNDEVVYELTRSTLAQEPTEQQPWILTHLKQQKNQMAFVINNPDKKPERSAHRIEEYSRETTQNYQLANVMKNCVLYNMLNNSVQNFESDSFIPLLDCLTLPKSLRFTKATQPLEKLKTKAQQAHYTRSLITPQKSSQVLG